MTKPSFFAIKPLGRLHAHSKKHTPAQDACPENSGNVFHLSVDSLACVLLLHLLGKKPSRRLRHF